MSIRRVPRLIGPLTRQTVDVFEAMTGWEEANKCSAHPPMDPLPMAREANKCSPAGRPRRSIARAVGVSPPPL